MKNGTLVLTTMLVAVMSVAIASPEENHGLKGIKSVGVVIEEEDNFDGDRQQLQSYVELKLRIAHLKIVTPRNATPDQTIIDVIVSTSPKRAATPRPLNVQIEILQPAILVRDAKITVPDAITARYSQVSILGAGDDITSSVKASASLLLDLFLNDYRAANTP
jgi:hypothetical protein